MREQLEVLAISMTVGPAMVSLAYEPGSRGEMFQMTAMMAGIALGLVMIVARVVRWAISIWRGGDELEEEWIKCLNSTPGRSNWK